MRESQEQIFADIPELRTVDRADRSRIKSFVLRSTQMKKSQIEAVKRYYGRYGVPYQASPIDLGALFGNDKPVIVEIGFGMGTATFQIAQERDGYNYLALEVFITGFAKLIKCVGEAELTNIRLMRFDAVAVLEDMIGDSEVAGFHIFFPDPWPKKRHHKRRLIQAPFAELLADKLRPGGYIYAVTDWLPYAEQMLTVFDSVTALQNPHNGFAPPVAWRPETRFEHRGLAEEHPISEVWVTKRS